jgi:hypothetical protein
VLIYVVTGSLAGVLYLGAVCALLMLPMFTLVLYWGYQLRLASAATPGWDDGQRRGLLKGTLWITASVIPAFVAVAVLQHGLSAGGLLSLALYSLSQYLGLRHFGRVYTSKLAQAPSGELQPPDVPRSRLGVAYALIFTGAILGCVALVLLYSARINEGALVSVAAAVAAGLGARRLLNVSRAV